VPHARLLDVHRGVPSALEGLLAHSWSLYAPEAFVPPCTLSMRAETPGVIVDAAAAGRLPIDAMANEVHLVDISTGRSDSRLA